MRKKLAEKLFIQLEVFRVEFNFVFFLFFLYYLLNLSFFNMFMQVTSEIFDIMVLLTSGQDIGMYSLRHWNVLIAFSHLLIWLLLKRGLGP